MHTNKLNLPPAVTAWLSGDDDEFSKRPVEPNVFRVTELVQPPVITVLNRRHRKDITPDASDFVWRRLGQSIHNSVLWAAKKAKLPALMEERIEHAFDTPAGKVTVTGKPDLWYPINQHPTLKLVDGAMDQLKANGQHADDFGVVGDWKTSSVWAVIFGRTDEWRLQLSIYALLLKRSLNLTTLSGENYVLLKDWSATEAARDPGRYPAQSIVHLPQPLFPLDEVERFVRDRIATLKAMETLPDAALTPCTPDERWEKPEVWAVMKEGRKTALRLQPTKAAALDWCVSNNAGTVHGSMSDNSDQPFVRLFNGISLEHRPGVRARCERCDWKPWCPLYATLNLAPRDAAGK